VKKEIRQEDLAMNAAQSKPLSARTQNQMRAAPHFSQVAEDPRPMTSSSTNPRNFATTSSLPLLWPLFAISRGSSAMF